jgi:hypothetical protein
MPMATAWRLVPLLALAAHGRAVACQMLSELDGAPLGLADQLGEPPLALDQRQVDGVSV